MSYFLLILAIVADLIDYYEHSLTFAAMALFAWGVGRITDSIDRRGP